MRTTDINEQKVGWWKVSFEITLDGQDVLFDDLSEVTQEHIINCLKDGYTQGQVIEDVVCEEEIE